MLELTLTGTGSAGGVPLWGCECKACLRARLNSRYQRRPSSLSLKTASGVTLIDAGRLDLSDSIGFEQLRRILLTHYHMDHVQGLFHLRWSEREPKIPVLGPPDEKGADDLFKHPGVFFFQPPLQPFETINAEGFSVTALPLNHSRPTYGYLISAGSSRVAYLTDTLGIPKDTATVLQGVELDFLIVDCSHPPGVKPVNHNDLNAALQLVRDLRPASTLLTHISHQMDVWLQSNPTGLPSDVIAATDGLTLNLG